MDSTFATQQESPGVFIITVGNVRRVISRFGSTSETEGFVIILMTTLSNIILKSF